MEVRQQEQAIAILALGPQRSVHQHLHVALIITHHQPHGGVVSEKGGAEPYTGVVVLPQQRERVLVSAPHEQLHRVHEVGDQDVIALHRHALDVDSSVVERNLLQLHLLRHQAVDIEGVVDCADNVVSEGLHDGCRARPFPQQAQLGCALGGEVAGEHRSGGRGNVHGVAPCLHPLCPLFCQALFGCLPLGLDSGLLLRPLKVVEPQPK